jgi:hypothetical protein
MRMIRLALVVLLCPTLLVAQAPSPKPSAEEIKAVNAKAVLELAVAGK